MTFLTRSDGTAKRSFLARLARDKRGNVFAMTAAAVVPMIGVVGGAIDASRMYLSHIRLQSACDAGVLAGRKAMVTPSDYAAGSQAEQRARAMFNFNFQDADFQTTGTSFRASADSTGRLSGTAVTTVPMSLMKVFGVQNRTTQVACSADVQIPNIDVVFVLDVTGSMDETINGTRKIASMRDAAIRFYDTLAAQLAAAGTNAGQVRYGIVPYSQAVNGNELFVESADAARGQLPLNALVSNMVAESRVANFDVTPANDKYIADVDVAPVRYRQLYDKDTPGSILPYDATATTGTRMSNKDCTLYGQNLSFEINESTLRKVTLFPNTTYPGDGNGVKVLYLPDGSSTAQSTQPTTGAGFWQLTFSRVSGNWEDNSGSSPDKYRTCIREVTRTRFVRQDFRFKNWTYKPVTYDVAAFRGGAAINYVTAVNGSFVPPGPGPYSPVEMAAMSDKGGLTIASTTWDGCIEERDTESAATFQPIPAGAKDLDVKTGPTDESLRWRPILHRLTYNRGQPAAESTTANWGNPAYECPDRSMRNLNVMTRTEFVNYMNALTPAGATYLDVGMAWGLRLIAPQGMFAARNLTGPNGGQISRHVIFLTDGELAPQPASYSAYGMEVMSRRVTGTTGLSQTTLHARRFQALCDSQRGVVSIWAIGFGTSVTGNLTNCADPNRAYQANNATQLDAAFTAIAQDIADLRLVQ